MPTGAPSVTILTNFWLNAKVPPGNFALGYRSTGSMVEDENRVNQGPGFAVKGVKHCQVEPDRTLLGQDDFFPLTGQLEFPSYYGAI